MHRIWAHDKEKKLSAASIPASTSSFHLPVKGRLRRSIQQRPTNRVERFIEAFNKLMIFAGITNEYIDIQVGCNRLDHTAKSMGDVGIRAIINDRQVT